MNLSFNLYYKFVYEFVLKICISNYSAGWKLGSSICQMSGFAHTGLGDPIKRQSSNNTVQVLTNTRTSASTSTIQPDH